MSSIQYIRKDNIKRYIIGICGASCSGKTTLCHLIEKILMSHPNIKLDDILILSQDRYYKGGDSRTNYDIPDSLEFTLLISDLKKLINGEIVNLPNYDFKTHSRCKETTQVKPPKIIIVEGILIYTQNEVRDLCDLKLFVSAYPELCYNRRLERDIKERDRNENDIKEQYFRDVLPSTNCYVTPMMNFSDMVLMNNTKDNFIGSTVITPYIKQIIKEIS